MLKYKRNSQKTDVFSLETGACLGTISMVDGEPSFYTNWYVWPHEMRLIADKMDEMRLIERNENEAV